MVDKKPVQKIPVAKVQKRAYEFPDANSYEKETGLKTFTQDSIGQFIEDVGKPGTRPRKLMEKVVGTGLPYNLIADYSEGVTEYEERDEEICEKFKKGMFNEDGKAVENRHYRGQGSGHEAAIPQDAARREKDGPLAKGKDDETLKTRDASLGNFMNESYISTDGTKVYFGDEKAFSFDNSWQKEKAKADQEAFEAKLKEWGAKEGLDFYYYKGLSNHITIIKSVSLPAAPEGITEDRNWDDDFTGKRHHLIYQNGMLVMEGPEKAAEVGKKICGKLKREQILVIVERSIEHMVGENCPMEAYGRQYVAFLNACGITIDTDNVESYEVRKLLGKFQPKQAVAPVQVQQQPAAQAGQPAGK
jgi:hypothetical protein